MSVPVPDRVVICDARDEADPALALVEGEGSARAVVWPGMGARDRSMHRVVLEGGSRTVELAHPGEAVWYVAAGDGTVTDVGTGEESVVDAGAMVHAAAGDRYRFAAGDGPMVLVGGPCPADPALYERGAAGA